MSDRILYSLGGLSVAMTIALMVVLWRL